MHSIRVLGAALLAAGCGGTAANGPDVEEPERVETPEPVELGEPTEVSGSRISLRFPEGTQGVPQPGVFVAQRLVVIVGDSADPFAEAGQTVLAGWEREAGEVEEREPVDLDGHRGVLARGRSQPLQGGRVRSWMLVVGDERGTSYVSVMGDAADDALARAVMESVRWDPERVIDSLRFFGVELDEVEGLTLLHTNNQAIHYVDAEGEPDTSTASLVVMFVTFPRPLTEGEHAQALGAALGDFEPRDLDTHQTLIAGESAFEATGLGTLEGVDIALYGAIVPAGPGAFVILAHVGSEQADPYVDRFRTLARSLRR